MFLGKGYCLLAIPSTRTSTWSPVNTSHMCSVWLQTSPPSHSWKWIDTLTYCCIESRQLGTGDSFVLFFVLFLVLFCFCFAFFFFTFCLFTCLFVCFFKLFLSSKSPTFAASTPPIWAFFPDIFLYFSVGTYTMLEYAKQKVNRFLIHMLFWLKCHISWEKLIEV